MTDTPAADRRVRVLLGPLFVTFAVFGATLTVFSATVPPLIRDFQWSYTLTAIVLAATSVGYFTATFLSGLLIRRFGPKAVIATCLAAQAVGLALFAAWPVAWANLPLTLLVGLGGGGTEVVVNFSVSRIERGGRSRLMSLIHAAFAIGAVAGALAVAELLGEDAPWRLAYRGMAAVVAATAAMLLVLPFGRLGPVEPHAAGQPGLRRLLLRPLPVLASLILMLYVGVELGVAKWIAEYYVAVLGATQRTGARMVAVFWAGLLAGRLGVSYLYRGTRPAGVLVGLAVLATAGLATALAMDGPWTAGLAFVACGLGLSAIYPLVIAIVGSRTREGQSVVLGFASTGGGIGGFALPLVLAAIADPWGLRAGFAFAAGLGAAVIALGIVVLVLTRPAAPEEGAP
jgi:fucose permease